ncbi:Malonyl-CoA decarboxylase, mitochondrial [Chionoecetes opilio]|uniref:Malonyl-CoA decarboxylase, mitochondrial n=1 Tax=Chionoecetes opilio TaxID=41210 RepID=A0A8J5CIL1_CHIOP|nr:Malonyl-CoA decarboxylase, mitochondrial [Chionoecetes opilio]
MYACKYSTIRSLLPLVQVIEHGGIEVRAASTATMASTPPGSPGHRPGSCKTMSSSPIPIVRSGVALTPISLGSFSFSSSRPFTPSPMPSPPSSPPAPSSPSGLIQAAKDALMSAVSKRDSKTSFLAIDVDGSNADNGAQLLRWEDRLRQSLQPTHHWVFSQMSRLSGGVKFLVDMRQDLLATLYTKTPNPTPSAVLKTLDTVMRELLSLWFTVGLLDVQRITWESSCNMLQKISEYEAVHPVRNWADLKRRVGPYRRCFTFTHSCMPKEPLVVLHIFLTSEISRSMVKILQSSRASSIDKDNMKKDCEDPAHINTAIFYSITSTQKGLQTLKLSMSFPGEVAIFMENEEKALMDCLEVDSSSAIYDRLKKLFTTNGWVEDSQLVDALEAPLMRLCAYYLVVEKRRGYALDSVESQEMPLSDAVKFLVNKALLKVVKNSPESPSASLSLPRSPTPPLITYCKAACGRRAPGKTFHRPCLLWPTFSCPGDAVDQPRCLDRIKGQKMPLNGPAVSERPLS